MWLSATDDSLLKMLYLAMIDITKKWAGKRKGWGGKSTHSFKYSLPTDYRSSIKYPPNQGWNKRPIARAHLTFRQFHTKLQLRGESRNPAFTPQKTLRLYHHFAVNFEVYTK